MKTVVVTGSSRGIGFHLAKGFLKANCQVMLSGRNPETLQDAAHKLQVLFPQAQVATCVCDMADFQQVEALWQATLERYGKVDIWINNAGQGHSQSDCWEIPASKMASIVTSNVLGVMYGSKVAMQGMLKQGFGAIYNMEGLGSDGRIVDGLAIYGSTKSAVRYFTRALIKEAAETPVIVGTLSPGMVMTDLIIKQYVDDPAGWEKAKRIFNILADKPETVTAWMVPQILANTRHGKAIAWLTQWKVIGRFIGSMFTQRNVTD